MWVPIGGLLLIGWVAVLSAGRMEPSDEDRAVALAGLPALALAAVLLIVIWLAPGVRADVVLDLGLVVVGGVLVLMRPRVARSAVAFVPVAGLGLVAIVCAFSGAKLVGGIGETHVAPRNPAAVASYRRAIGTVTFDATRWRGLAGRTEHVGLSVGIGNIWIVVPQDVYATIDARLGPRPNGWRAGHRELLRAPPILSGYPAVRRTVSAAGPTPDQRPSRRCG